MSLSTSHFETSPITGEGFGLINGSFGEVRRQEEELVQNNVAVRNSRVVEMPESGSVSGLRADVIAFVDGQACSQIEASVEDRVDIVLASREDNLTLNSGSESQFLNVDQVDGCNLYAANCYWYEKSGFVLTDKDFMRVCDLKLNGVDEVRGLNLDLLVLRSIVSAVSDAARELPPSGSDGLRLIGYR